MNKLAFLLALVALALLGGGTATAAKLLTGKDVRNSSLTGADLKNGSVGLADLAVSARPRTGAPGAHGPAGPAGPQGPAGAAGGPGADAGYTRGQADERFLASAAQATDAAKLDGRDRDDYVSNPGAVSWNVVERAVNTTAVKILDLGDLGAINVQCNAGAEKTVGMVNARPSLAVYSVAQRRHNSTPLLTRSSVPANSSWQILDGGSGDYQATFSIRGDGRHATLYVTATDDGATCRWAAQAVMSQG